MRAKHNVSTKAILFNASQDKVLIANYGNGLLGLPGGHIESEETPDAAMKRELQEELGLSGVDLRRFDFGYHRDGKIVLFFAGTISEDARLSVDQAELESADWLDVSEIIDDGAAIGSYTPFIINAHKALSST